MINNITQLLTSSIISLKNQKEFDFVNKKSSKFSCKYFILVMAKNCYKLPKFTDKDIFLGMKVGRKLDKKAVVRNKVKRRIRHLITLMRNNTELLLPGLSLIIIPKKGFDKAPFDNLLIELEKMMPKI